MDERRSDRRRKLTPAEERALERQRKQQRDIQQKRTKEDARHREDARRRKMNVGESAHVVVEIPTRPQKKSEKANGSQAGRKQRNSEKTSVRQKNAENSVRKKTSQKAGNSGGTKKTATDPQKNQDKINPANKRKKKTTPDIIKSETNKRVREMSPKDYADGYYVDEVEVRRAQAKEQRQKRRDAMPKALTPKQRKFRQRLTYVLICTVIVVIGLILSLTVLFKTETIEVKGNKLYSESDIIELAGVSKGENIFVATMFGNTDNVEDKLVYVKEAKISFEIPNKLIINIRHEEPFACIKSKGKHYLINDKGKILEEVDKAPKKLIKLTAGELKSSAIGDCIEYKNKKTTKVVNEITRCLSENNYTGVTAIDVEKMAQITITYDNRILIKIGLPEDIDYKLLTAFKIINQKLDPQNTGKIKGVLDVSECNDTKKSYFNEGDLKEDTTTAPTVVTQETTATETVRSTFVTVPEEETDSYYEEEDSDYSYEEDTDYSYEEDSEYDYQEESETEYDENYDSDVSEESVE